MEETNPVARLLNEQIPQKLWHYTSIQGFQGIVRSKRIFATDLRFLNDREEFTHAHDLAGEIVEETPEEAPNGMTSRKFLRDVVNLVFNTGPLHPNRLQVYVASFTAAEDLLSQWRGYSYGSSGVSLAFDLKAFRPPVGTDTFVSFAPCVYDLGQKKELMRHALHHFMYEIEGYWNSVYSTISSSPQTLSGRISVKEQLEKNMPAFQKRLGEANIKTSADLLRIAALLKNASFKEEREWRLVLPVSASKEALANPPQFRGGSTTLIPYIAHPFSNNPGTPLPLVDVILGPGSHVNSVSATQRFLESEGIRLVPRESRVPYRPL